MKRKRFAIMAGILFTSSAVAQAQAGAQAGAQVTGETSARVGKTQAQGSSSAETNSSASAQNGQARAALGNGSGINAELASPVDSKKAKPGDPIKGRITQAVKSGDKTVIPRGAKLVGHVTQATARAKGDSDSTLGIVFDKAILKDGQELPLNVAVQALASAQSAATSSAGDEMPPMGGAGTSVAGSGSAVGSGAIGGVASTTGAAAGTVTNTAANAGSTAGGALRSTAHSTTGTVAGEKGAVGGLTAAGQLSSDSRGVFGLHGIGLTSATTGTAMAAIITSTGKNVHLDSGAQLLLVTQTTNAAPRP